MPQTSEQRAWLDKLLDRSPRPPAALANQMSTEDSGGGPGAPSMESGAEGGGGGRGAGPGESPATVSFPDRPLTAAEVSYAKSTFKDSVDYGAITLTYDALASAGSSRTLGNTVNMTADEFEPGTNTLTSAGLNTLVHEMTHVWQYQHHGWGYAPAALWAQFWAALTTGSRNGAYDWKTPATSGVPWDDWNPEAQAEGVERYNEALHAMKAGTPSQKDIDDLAILEPYIAQMSAGPPNTPDGGDSGAEGHSGEEGSAGGVGKAFELDAGTVKALGQTVGDFAKKAEVLVAAVGEVAGHAADKARHVAAAAVDAEHQLVKKAADAAASAEVVAHEVVQAVEDTAKAAVAGASEAAGKAAAAVSDAASAAAGSFADAATSVLDRLFGDDEKK